MMKGLYIYNMIVDLDASLLLRSHINKTAYIVRSIDWSLNLMKRE